MCEWRKSFLVLGWGVASLVASGELQAQGGGGSATGPVRSELVLDFGFTRGLTSPAVSFAPTLQAEVLDEQRSSAGSASMTRVRLGELTVPAWFSVGTIAGLDQSADETYSTWLVQTSEGWTLDLLPRELDRLPPPTLGQIPLTLQHRGYPYRETFSASLLPTGHRAGQLLLRWGYDSWTADFQLEEPPPTDPNTFQTEGESSVQDSGGIRPFDDEVAAQTAARLTMLGERNETVIGLPNNSRIQLLFQRDIDSDHPDLEAIGSLADGEVIRLTEAAVLRLRTEVPLLFGDVSVPIGNLDEGFPGSYGIWLKRVGTSWRVVFNNEPESWGTQHDPAFDAYEIDVTYSPTGLSRPLGTALVPTSADSGQLVIHWGSHEWSADFTIDQ